MFHFAFFMLYFSFHSKFFICHFIVQLKFIFQNHVKWTCQMKCKMKNATCTMEHESRNVS